MLPVKDYFFVLGEIKRLKSFGNAEVIERSYPDAYNKGLEKLVDKIKDDYADAWASNFSFSKSVLEQKENKNLQNKIYSLSILLSSEEQEAFEYNDICEKIEEIVNEMYWYDRQLLEMYVRLGNYRAIEKETGIPFVSCYKTIQKGLQFIRNEIEKHKKKTSIQYGVPLRRA